ncbi:hypothetical protein SAMN06272735_7381 [Streptomyces sp. TLI_55]|uniref:hypothetical protein n=1 Tax=Streptomyces sp. TLI_55 TaxID=1938861 RepID=UPI000BDD4DD0|nr:hypothetical protein [Streptomyces sp. TLI_55]SNX65542.1 hypothetical protein SAMN06272735_7381 [Streptomyces sp. TLI_55]
MSDDSPRTYAPLPDRPDGRRAAFHGHVAELIEFLGAEPPAAAGPDREWEHEARTIVRRALRAAEAPPEGVFERLVRTGVHDPNPSFNRQFIEPAVRLYGRRRVKAALIDVLRTGSDAERAGAARAWYWTGAPVRYLDGETRVMTPESRAEVDSVADLEAEWQEAALREFIANEDLGVRRCILPGLVLETRRRPAELHGLVAEAVRIARGHSDPYLRDRVEIQVGE